MAGWKLMWLVHKPYVGASLCNTLDAAKWIASSWTNKGHERTGVLRLTKPMANRDDVYFDPAAGITIRRTEGKQHRGYVEAPGQVYRSDGMAYAYRSGRHWNVQDASGDTVDEVPTQADAVLGIMSPHINRRG